MVDYLSVNTIKKKKLLFYNTITVSQKVVGIIRSINPLQKIKRYVAVTTQLKIYDYETKEEIEHADALKTVYLSSIV